MLLKGNLDGQALTSQQKRKKKKTFHTYSKYFYICYPEEHIVQSFILCLSDLFYMHIYFVLFTWLSFPCLPDFLITPNVRTDTFSSYGWYAS